mmetsp:Transcript_26746/g.45525  ORF Transcript_26746/g.45525 Transcript_26746/m.45525 type:complete len:343 (+) Transcript_26746:32-1060(+)
MMKQHCLSPPLDTMKKRKEEISSPWWDLFSRCRGEEPYDSEDDDCYNDMSTSTAADDCSGSGCVSTAVDNVVSILRSIVSPSSSNGSPGEEDQEEVVTTHHMEPTSTCGGSCLDDKIEESNNDPVDDNTTANAVESPQAEDPIPNIDDEEESNTNETVATSLNDATRSVKEDVDTALKWFVLSGILGSPAPASIVKHGKKRDITLFWDLEEGIIRGDYDDIPDIQEDSIDAFKDEEGADRLNDSCTTASLSSYDDYESEGDFFIVPDIDDVEHQQVSNEFSPQETLASHSAKEVADSALAWGALAMILNAPAPSAVATNCTTKHPFEDDELTVELDDVVLPL